MKLYRVSILVAVLLAHGLAFSQKYTVTVVDGLPGATETYIGGFNARNQLLGSSRFSVGVRKSFLYENGTYIEFVSPGIETRSADLNDHGVVVGSFMDESEVWHAFIWTAELGLRRLFPNASVETTANAINNHGDIVGMYDDRPFLLKQGKLIMLPTLYEYGYSVPSKLNNSGVIIGAERDQMTEFSVPVRWVNEEIELLSGGPAVRPSDINESGQIAGSHFAFHIHTQYPVTWINSQLQVLPTFVGRGFANGINSRGDIAGQALDRNWQSNTACIWVDGRFIPLQQFVNPSEWVLISASSIDDRGRITGYGWYQSAGNVRGFIMTPVDGRR